MPLSRQHCKELNSLSSILFSMTKYHVLLKGPARYTDRATEVSILASHGRLLWGSVASDTERTLTFNEEEIPVKAVGIETNSAAAMWGGLKHVLPQCLCRLLQGVLPSSVCQAVAICTASDRLSANLMMVQHIANNSNAAVDKIFVLPGWCNQHNTGNALEPLLQHLEVLPPLFCLGKRMRNEGFQKRFHVGLKKAIRMGLRHIKGSEDPTWRPAASDTQHAELIMELLYYRRDLRDEGEDRQCVFMTGTWGGFVDVVGRILLGASSLFQGGHEDSQTSGERLRRERARKLLARCPGNWKLAGACFWDPDNEFASQDAVVDEIYRLLMLVAFHNLEEPAANKWLSVWPVVGSVGMMQSFHHVFLFALRYACQLQGDEADQLQAAMAYSDDELVGSLSKEAWHRRERRRQLKALAWAETKHAQFCLALFAFVGSHGMNLHFAFFKHCQTNAFGNDRGFIFKLCGPNSPVAEAIAKLWALLQNDAPWAPMESLFGPLGTWRADWRAIAVDLVKMLIAGLERRLVGPLNDPPFKYWVPIADPDSPQELKLKVATQLFEADEKTLDESSIKLRRRTRLPATLLDPFWQAFMFHAMNKIGLSSAFVECLFAHFKQWQAGIPRPIGPALLISKHIAHEFKVVGERKRKREHGDSEEERRKVYPRRPARVIKRGDCGMTNARHVYVGQVVRGRQFGVLPQEAFKEAVAAWRVAPEDDRAKARSQAIVRNSVARTLKHNALQNVCEPVEDFVSLWNIGRGSPFPLHPEAVDKVLQATGKVATLAAEWAEKASVVVAADVNFPAVVAYRRLIPPLLVGLGAGMQQNVNAIMAAFQTIIGARGFEVDRYKGKLPICPLMFVKTTASAHVLAVQPCNVAKSPEFQFHAMVFHVDGCDSLWIDTTSDAPLTLLPVNGEMWTGIRLAREVASVSGGPYTYQYAIIASDVNVNGIPGAIVVTGSELPLDIMKLREENRTKARPLFATPWARSAA